MSNFSLEEMNKAVSSPKHVVPSINTMEDLDAWLEDSAEQCEAGWS